MEKGPKYLDERRTAGVYRIRPLADVLKEVSADVPAEVMERARQFFQTVGIHSPLTLHALSVKGDLDEYARRAGLSAQAMKAIADAVVRELPLEAKREVEEEARRPYATGQIDWSKPEVKRFYELQGIKEPKRITKAEFDRIRLPNRLPYLIPNGPKKAVDLRPFLGDARDQNPRGTCAAFAGTAVAEAMEYYRDRRRGTIDLAEEFVWWYRCAGQRYSAGGYDCSAAVDDIRDVGAPEEYVLPYKQVQINDNHTQVPIDDKAMDRAQFYKGGDSIGLPWGDVDAVKKVLESGRCVCYASNLDGWNTGTGEITMPPAGTQLGGSHCTSIVGYIDRDDLAADLGGGYFIIRNSWGGAGSSANILGPDYGGHLLMPYAWYKSYAGWPATTTDKNDAGHRNKWLVEYFDNPELKGAPLETRTVQYNWLFFNLNTTVTFDQEVDAVNYDWGSGSPVKVTLPLWFGEADALPVDNFSVRFSQVMRLREGWFRFHLRVDDGVRLYVDDRLVINGWTDQADTAYVAEHYVTGGDHVIRIEYYEATGQADVHFTVEPITWHYELFHDYSFTRAAATFDDTLTQLEWRHAPPVTAGGTLTRGQFGLRGTATFNFAAGKYRFHNFSTGAARVYLDGVQVANLPNPGDNVETNVAAGSHIVQIEFMNASTVPADGSHSYYRAICNVTWSQSAWNARFYKDTRAEYYSSHWSDLGPDANYVFFRTSGLAGLPLYTHDYPESNVMNNTLDFNSWDDFKASLADWPSSFDMKFWGVWINRRIAITQAGHYNLKLDANEGFRLIVNGRQIVENQVGIGNSPYNDDLYLDAGMHDVSIEYCPTQWGGNLNFAAQPANWYLNLYANRDLSGNPSQSLYAPIEDLVSTAAAHLGTQTNFSVRAQRTFFLPLGKYMIRVWADDGVRVRVNQQLLIDAWYLQAPTAYAATFEHMGGNVPIEVEYFQGEGGAMLALSLHPTDFYAEYYNNKTLNVMPPGVDRPRVTPITYRYDEDIDFDWGAGSQLPRVGATTFSARWRGKVNLPVGRWRVDATSDDGIRVYVDGRLLIDQWHDQSKTTHSRMIDLVGRDHDVTVEYYQNAGVGSCKVKYVRLI